MSEAGQKNETRDGLYWGFIDGRISCVQCGAPIKHTVNLSRINPLDNRTLVCGSCGSEMICRLDGITTTWKVYRIEFDNTQKNDIGLDGKVKE